ncbi:MAG: type I restriction enzyme HsdR N-terminal domain-containing protein [Candidatus Sericytochromatia bacterium]|nr:type I restriction enzyme HsdR N-terminal domain-containing protein [Candidatus Sericytochromatia bacterium]
MNEEKRNLSERDICTRYITPAIVKAGWDKKFREEVSFTDGKIIVRGSLLTRGKKRRADYILYYKDNLPIAVVEAKDNNHTVGDGMQQALDYSRILELPFVLMKRINNKIN